MTQPMATRTRGGGTTPRVSILLPVHQAAATSGDTYRYVELDGRRYSHIVNPRTGVGLTRRLIVTVSAPACPRPDGLASAVSVLGVQRGMAMVE